MAATNLLSRPDPTQYSGTTDHTTQYSGQLITDLQTMVERTILDTRPLLSIGQIRVLLRVFDACEQCEGTGTTYYSNGGDSGDNLLAERCDVCKGKGHVPAADPQTSSKAVQ